MALSFAKLRRPASIKAKDLDPDTAIIDDLSPDSLIVPATKASARESRGGAVGDGVGAGVFAGAGAGAAAKSETTAKVKRGPLGLANQEISGFRRQMQMQMPIIVVSFVTALVFLGLDTRQANDGAMLHQLVGDALTHSQRLAKSAPNAMLGNPDGVKQLIESRDQLARAVGALKVGENPDTGRSNLDCPAKAAAITGAGAQGDRRVEPRVS
jgi:hypothetical protein